MVNSPAKSVALAIAPKVTAALSICGSSIIIALIARSPKRQKQTMGRIMLGLSICDILPAVFFFASTWPIPIDTPSRFGDGSQPIYGAIGNDASCQAAGFWNQFQVSSPLYISTLATYFLLRCYCNWKEFRLRKVEWIFHVVPILYALITSIFAVATKLIGEVEWTCWINPVKKETALQRNFQIIQWICLFGPVWICIFYVSIIFAMLYKKMRELEDKVSSYSCTLPEGHNLTSLEIESRNTSCEDHEESRKIAVQGMHYVVAFWIVWLFPTISRFLDIANAQSYWVQLFDTMFIPLQGAFNCFVYIRPDIVKHRGTNPNAGLSECIRAVIVRKN